MKNIKKYKMKYLQIQKEFKLLMGGKCDSIRDFKTIIELHDIHAISFHDPLGDGLVSGDKDDNVAMMFEALVFGPRLTIVIVDGNTEGTPLLDRFNNPSLQPFFRELREKYGCTILDGNLPFSIKNIQIAFICAPINDKISTILQDTESIKDIYMQGDIPNGVNYKNSYDLAQTHINSKYNNRLTMLGTSHTRISFKFTDIDFGAYMKFKYYNELQRHILAQIVALPKTSLPYALGLLISTADIQKIPQFEQTTTSFGSLYNNTNNMLTLLQSNGVDIPKSISPEFKDPLEKYARELLTNKFPNMDLETISPLLEEINNRLTKTAIIATALLEDPTIIINKLSNSMHTFQTLPPLILKDESIIFADKTPELFDFITVAIGLQHSLNKKISLTTSRAEEIEFSPKLSRSIESIEDVLSNKDKVMPLCIGLFNEIVNLY